MKKILVDGRFVGVGDSVSRTTLETLKAVLKLDRENEYTLMIRPQGEKVAKAFFCNNQDILRQAQDPFGARYNNQTNFKFQIPNSTFKYENLHLKVLDIPHYSLKEQTVLLRYLNKEKFDLVHFMQFNHPVRYKGKFIVNILDLTLFGHLYRKNKIKGLAFNTVMKSAVKNSVKIITVSETSKKDIVETYGVDPANIDVTYLGVDEKYNNNIKNQRSKIKNTSQKYRINGDYILYTGMWKRHKNILKMLEAFEKSRVRESISPKVQLVLAGKIDKNEPEVTETINKINNSLRHPEPIDCSQSSRGVEGFHDSNNSHPGSDSVIPAKAGIQIESPDNGQPTTDYHPAILAVGFVDEADLPYLYAGALCYCIPSLSEGFGLPPLEAMACGTPVISSNVSAMPEILGDAPLYFDPYSVDDIQKAIFKIVSDERLRSELSNKGLEQVKKYSWDRTGEGTLKVYQEILLK